MVQDKRHAGRSRDFARIKTKRLLRYARNDSENKDKG